jgi:LysM repeat protein
MNRIIASMIGALVLAQAIARADEAQTLQEVRELKQLMEQQMKRIDELTIEVGRLHQAVEAQKASAAPGPAPKREVVGPPPFSGFTEMKPEAAKSDGSAKPDSVAKAEAAAKPEIPEVPKAEAVGGVKHVVAKGETLTSIAKHYNIALADLQKANKDVNDRKLQIGQTLTVPVTKPSEPAPTEKKENL